MLGSTREARGTVVAVQDDAFTARDSVTVYLMVDKVTTVPRPLNRSLLVFLGLESPKNYKRRLPKPYL